MSKIKQPFYLIASSTFPAGLNIAGLFFGLLYLDNSKLGEIFASMAILYIAIDCFNFGTTRIMASKGRHSNGNLVSLDILSALLSACITPFLMLAFLERVSLLLIISMSITAFIFSFSHSALGWLRSNHRNELVLIALTGAATIRLTGIIATYLLNFNYESLALIFCSSEIIYGLFLAASYKQISKQSITKFTTLDHFRSKEIYTSWWTNFIQGLIKHFDIVLLSVTAGNSAVALYRPIKSIANLSGNLGTSFSQSFLHKSGTIAKYISLKRYYTLITLIIPTSGFIYFFLNEFNISERVVITVSISLILSSSFFLSRFFSFIAFAKEEHHTVVATPLIEAAALFIMLSILSFKIPMYSGPIALTMASFLSTSYLLLKIKK